MLGARNQLARQGLQTWLVDIATIRRRPCEPWSDIPVDHEELASDGEGVGAWGSDTVSDPGGGGIGLRLRPVLK